jgi:CDGSH iron-sulfur domain-containing protein 3
MGKKDQKTQFRIIKDGPLEITGIFIITGSDGKPREVISPAYLCRCGNSHNKPFCDGSHKSKGSNT